MDISSSELALVDTYPPSSYTHFSALQQLVNSTSESLYRGGQQQFLAFKHVAKRNFAYIERRFKELHHARFTYFGDIETLIVKVPSRWTEVAHASFSQYISFKVFDMHVSLTEFKVLGATKYTGTNDSSKECDESWTNGTIRPHGYPYLVVEAGLPGTRPRLRAAAAWLFAHLRGEVNIVILIDVDRAKKKITVDKYIERQVPGPTTGACTRAGPEWQPEKVRTVVINTEVSPSTVEVTSPSNATGPPLTLEFEKVFGRAPNPPVEHDIYLDTPLLVEWAENVFR